MRVWLVRHGESEGNLAGTLQGQRIDTPLSLMGRSQAQALAVRLAGELLDAVVSSPLARARETAEIAVAPHGLGLRIDPELVEFDWGSWTGQPVNDELERLVGDLRTRWRAGDVEVPTPGGESPVRAAARGRRVLERLRTQGPRAPLVVAHGRFNRVLMALLLGRDLSRMDEIRQRNGSLSSFEWDGVSPASPILLDDISHLNGIARSTARDDVPR